MQNLNAAKLCKAKNAELAQRSKFNSTAVSLKIEI